MAWLGKSRLCHQSCSSPQRKFMALTIVAQLQLAMNMFPLCRTSRGSCLVTSNLQKLPKEVRGCCRPCLKGAVLVWNGLGQRSKSCCRDWAFHAVNLWWWIKEARVHSEARAFM